MTRIAAGEKIGVLGLARSGVAAARLALKRRAEVYASDFADNEATREAAEMIRQAGGDAEVGGHDLAKLQQCSRIVLSPGIPPSAKVLRAPEIEDVPVIPELEFAYRELEGPVIAVTGTNGKTTVTALTAHALRAAGKRADAGGNIGIALSELALKDPQPEVVVAETSSFQLGMTRSFSPEIGILTNLAPDHLDWYSSVAEYYGDKAKLFQNATPESHWIINGEDEEAVQLPGSAAGNRYLFRISSEPAEGEEGGWLAEDGSLMVRLQGVEQKVIHANELKILGPHNIANSLAAAIAAMLVGADVEGVAEGLRTFRPLDHRLEPVVERRGILWVNDSKATNVASTRVGIHSLDRPTVLLLGGRHKGEEYSALIPDFQGRVHQVVAFGEAAERIESALSAAVPVERVEGSFVDVLKRAAELARSGDAILLSPACSSYDMFKDYEDRGRQYRKLVLEEVA